MAGKGTFVAYQPLKPTELKVGDIWAQHVDNFIKMGEAKKAQKLKRMQEENARMEDYFGKFKFDPKETDKYLTDMNHQLNSSVLDRFSEYKRNAFNAETNYDRAKWMQKADKLAKQWQFVQTNLGGQKFLKSVQDARDFAASGDAFDDSAQMKLLKAYESGSFAALIDDNDNIVFDVITGDKMNDENSVERFDLTRIMALATGQAQVDLLEDTKGRKGLYSDMKAEARTMVNTSAMNPTGDFLTKTKEFVREKAGISFDSKYGEFNANRPTDGMDDLMSTEYGQFAIKNIGKIPTNEEEHKAAREAYINKMWSYASESEELINRVSDYKREQDAFNREMRLAKLYASASRGGGVGSSSGGGGNNWLGDGTLSVGNVVLNIKGKNNEHYNTTGVSYFVSGNTDGGKASKVGVTAYWNPNAIADKKTGKKGAFRFAMNIPSNDGKQVVIEGVNSERAKQILASNKVKNPENVLAIMVSTAEQNGLAGIAPKVFGRNQKNFKVNFNPNYSSGSSSNSSQQSQPLTPSEQAILEKAQQRTN